MFSYLLLECFQCLVVEDVHCWSLISRCCETCPQFLIRGDPDCSLLSRTGSASMQFASTLYVIMRSLFPRLHWMGKGPVWSKYNVLWVLITFNMNDQGINGVFLCTHDCESPSSSYSVIFPFLDLTFCRCFFVWPLRVSTDSGKVMPGQVSSTMSLLLGILWQHVGIKLRSG